MTDLRGNLAALLPRLRRFGLALTGTVAEADDLVQGACERALSRSGQLRDHARLDAWVYGIMRNLWIDETRSRKLRRHDGMDSAAAIVGEDGEQVAHGILTLAAVRQVLATLTPEQQSVLILVCVDGLRYGEAAAVLGIPIGTVMSRLARGREELRARLEAGAGRSHAPVSLRVVRSTPGAGPGERP